MPNKIRFFYDNYWNDYTIIPSTEHPHFPAENTQNRDPEDTWQSRNGVGSSWGQFTIVAGVNDRIDFEETIGVNLVGVLTPGVYNIDSILAHVKTQMELVGGSTYTWEYIETGAVNVNHVRVTSNGAGGGGVFRLMWATGPNTARSVGGTLGYDVSADDVGALTYTADYIRIHTEEYLTTDMGVARLIQGAIIKNHNIQTSGLIQIWGSNVANFATGIQISYPIQDDIILLFWSGGQLYRYWRQYIEDPDNPDGYVELGVCFLGPHFESLRHFGPDRMEFPEDPSLVKYSEHGQISTIQRTHFKTKDYIIMATEEKDNFDTMFAEVGKSKGLFISEYPESHPLVTTDYVKFNEWEWEHHRGAPWSPKMFYNYRFSTEKLR